MVREITLFEVHLDESLFGSTDAEEPPAESGGSKLWKVIVLGLFVGLILAVVRRGQRNETVEESAGTESPVEVEIEA